MGELGESLNKTTDILLAGQTITVSKITMGIWAKFEDLAESRIPIEQQNKLSVEQRAMIAINFLQTTIGRLELLAMCMSKVGEKITGEQLGDTLSFSDMADVINAATALVNESQPVKLPGEDDGQGNPPEGTDGA